VFLNFFTTKVVTCIRNLTGSKFGRDTDYAGIVHISGHNHFPMHRFLTAASTECSHTAIIGSHRACVEFSVSCNAGCLNTPVIAATRTASYFVCLFVCSGLQLLLSLLHREICYPTATATMVLLLQYYNY
jgi:hypothetical protein